jgi:hypothetical protein
MGNRSQCQRRYIELAPVRSIEARSEVRVIMSRRSPARRHARKFRVDQQRVTDAIASAAAHQAWLESPWTAVRQANVLARFGDARFRGGLRECYHRMFGVWIEPGTPGEIEEACRRMLAGRAKRLP